ncbi:MAG: hypothetical protein OSA39_11945, partial [Sphingobium sp.]|nr:hypothetical protein [Sphingobium sp.]
MRQVHGTPAHSLLLAVIVTVSRSHPAFHLFATRTLFCGRSRDAASKQDKRQGAGEKETFHSEILDDGSGTLSHRYDRRTELGSRLIDQSQKMTVAASA